MKGSCIYASPGGLVSRDGGYRSSPSVPGLARSFGLPVWQLLGGKYRDFVRIYADCHAGDALESITCMLAPRTPHWMRAEGETSQHKSVVSLKHHGWDASKQATNS